MKKVMRVTDLVSKAFSVFSIIALLVMLFITLIDVLLRSLFNSPVTGTVEIARMMMVCMAPAFIYTLVQGRHVRVGLFIDRLGRKAQLVFDTFGHLAAAGLCGAISYRGFVFMFQRMEQGQVYSMLRIPTWPFYLLFSASMGAFAIAAIICLVDIYLDKDRYVKKLEPEPTDSPAPTDS